MFGFLGKIALLASSSRAFRPEMLTARDGVSGQPDISEAATRKGLLH
jgi:hypothetical protein